MRYVFVSFYPEVWVQKEGDFPRTSNLVLKGLFPEAAKEVPIKARCSHGRWGGEPSTRGRVERGPRE